MADVSKADWQALNDRLRVLENDMVLVRLAKWLFGLSVVAFVGAGGAAIYLSGLTTNEVKNLGDRIGKLEQAQADQQKENSRLLELIYNRVKVSALVYEGRIVKAAADVLIIKEDGPDGKERPFLLPPDVNVTLKGNAAKVEDLRAGMRVRVTTGKSSVAEWVDAEPPPPPPSSGLPQPK